MKLDFYQLHEGKGKTIKIGLIDRGIIDYVHEVEIFIPEETIKQPTDFVDMEIYKIA